MRFRRYAAATIVSSDRSRAEIEGLLTKYGATAFVYGWKNDAAVIQFELQNRRIKFILPLPVKEDQCFKKTPTGRTKRNPGDWQKAWEQESRSRWRGLALAIKAKLQSAADNIETFDEAFFAQIMLPDGSTVGESVGHHIVEAYKTGKVPPLLGPATTLKKEKL